MRINVTFKHMDSSDALKDYVQKRFEKINKYVDAPMDVKVVLTTEKFRSKAEVIIAANGLRTAAREEQPDMHSAIDLLSDKIEIQLRKFKERQVERGREPKQGIIPAQAPRPSDIILHVEKIDMSPLDVDQALDKLQSGSVSFVPFMNKDTNELSILFWREDGTLGLIEA
jgi:putative sigma-54 modulation protein